MTLPKMILWRRSFHLIGISRIARVLTIGPLIIKIQPLKRLLRLILTQKQILLHVSACAVLVMAFLKKKGTCLCGLSLRYIQQKNLNLMRQLNLNRNKSFKITDHSSSICQSCIQEMMSLKSKMKNCISMVTNLHTILLTQLRNH